MRSQPGETSGPANSDETPCGPFQKRSSEYPSAAVGTMNGMSDSVSSTFSHLDSPRLINQAMGTPVIKSRAETSRAIMKEFAIAVSICETSAGSLRTCGIVLHLIIIPRIGGIKISARNITTAAKYTPYLTLFVDESLSIASVILELGNSFQSEFLL